MRGKSKPIGDWVTVWRLVKIKLAKKLGLSISVVIIVVLILSFLLNTVLLQRYYLYEKKNELNQISGIVKDLSFGEVTESLEQLEKDHGVTIVYTPIINDLDKLNADLDYQLWRKKIRLNKFWVTPETLSQLTAGSVNKLYDQGKMGNSFLVKFMSKEGYLLVIGLSIPHLDEPLEMVNGFNLGLMLATLVVLIVLVWLVCRRTMAPISQLENMAREIATLRFKTVHLKTGDELESLAESLNTMSEKLALAHGQLEGQNQRLKQFAGDVSHELKTPIALIKAYGMGLEDGLDDGSYVQVIIEQAERMSELVDDLLDWARLDRQNFSREKVDMGVLLVDVLGQYEHLAKDYQRVFGLEMVTGEMYEVYGDKQALARVLHNLVSNALKYATGKDIAIKLISEGEGVTLTITNGIGDYPEEMIEQIWQPFFVLEPSRSKALSGTGLGLSIVQMILEQHGFRYLAQVKEERITFTIYFTNKRNN